MPRGPRGERRPEDPASAAVMVVRLAVGDISEALDETVRTKDPAAASRGRLGGLVGGVARSDRLAPERRHEIAKLAADRRWGRKRENDD